MTLSISINSEIYAKDDYELSLKKEEHALTIEVSSLSKADSMLATLCDTGSYFNMKFSNNLGDIISGNGCTAQLAKTAETTPGGITYIIHMAECEITFNKEVELND